jgi:hypothetical protein
MTVVTQNPLRNACGVLGSVGNVTRRQAPVARMRAGLLPPLAGTAGGSLVGAVEGGEAIGDDCPRFKGRAALRRSLAAWRGARASLERQCISSDMLRAGRK